MKRLIILLVFLLLPVTAKAQGVPKFYVTFAALVQLKPGAGNLVWLYCPSTASTQYLQLFDASVAPTLGTTPPNAVIDAGSNQVMNPIFGAGMRFFKGLYGALTTSANGATLATAQPCTFGIQ